MAYRIRAASEDDVPAIYSMLLESATEQKSENALCADPVNLHEDGFGVEARFRCLLAETDAKPVGVVLYFFVYSTWTSRNGLYVEDLYVAPQFRRHGIAGALMSAVARAAVESGCQYVQWIALRDNTAALRFYESIGARTLSEWTLMRVSGNELKRLSETLNT